MPTVKPQTLFCYCYCIRATCDTCAALLQGQYMSQAVLPNQTVQTNTLVYAGIRVLIEQYM
jgi:hypothetical protein